MRTKPPMIGAHVPRPQDVALVAIDAILAAHGLTIETYLDMKGKQGRPEPSARLLPEPEARQLLGGISRTTLYRLVKENRLAPVRIGRRLLFAQSDLESFIHSRRDN